jgi:hypothetical protein
MGTARHSAQLSANTNKECVLFTVYRSVCERNGRDLGEVQIHLKRRGAIGAFGDTPKEPSDNHPHRDQKKR